MVSKNKDRFETLLNETRNFDQAKVRENYNQQLAKLNEIENEQQSILATQNVQTNLMLAARPENLNETLFKVQAQDHILQTHKENLNRSLGRSGNSKTDNSAIEEGEKVGDQEYDRTDEVQPEIGDNTYDKPADEVVDAEYGRPELAV